MQLGNDGQFSRLEQLRQATAQSFARDADLAFQTERTLQNDPSLQDKRDRIISSLGFLRDAQGSLIEVRSVNGSVNQQNI